MCSSVEKTIQIHSQKYGRIIINLGKRLLNNCWMLYYGEIQQKLLQFQTREIIIDMTRCEFISPTPFLSFLLTLYYCKEVNKCSVHFVFPIIEDEKKIKFHKFCIDNGFTKIMNIIDPSLEANIELEKKDLTEHFNFEKIVEVNILDLNAYSNIDNVVTTILNGINEDRLKISKHNRIYLMVVIRNILMELFDNVYKHAYTLPEEKKYCAYYIRIRRSNRETCEIGQENNRYKNKETVKPYEVYLQNAVEIYFQDLGQGMINSLIKKNKIKRSERPLRYAVEKTFYGSPSIPRRGNTAVTGLRFLGDLLANGNNFFSIYDSYEGVGTFTSTDYVDRKRRINTNKISIKDEVENAYPIKGLIYNFTLFDRKQTESKNYSNYIQDILNIYSQPYNNCIFDVVDYRDDSVINVKGEKIDQDTVWIFPNQNNTKSMIVRLIKKALEAYKDKSRIIIADISDYEFEMFKGVLNDSYIDTFDPIKKIEKVYLVSSQLEFAALKKASIDQRKPEKIIRIDKNENFHEFNSKFNYLYKLKIYESMKLASILESDPIGKYAVTKGKIEWNNEIHISGYINFDFLVSNYKTYQILERNLLRLCAYWKDSKLYAIDVLTQRLVDSVNLKLEVDNSRTSGEIGIGSVIVSGLTLQSNNYEKVQNFHFFSRTVKNRYAALFFDPVYLYTDKAKDGKTYVRDGKSYRIRQKEVQYVRVKTNSYIDEVTMYSLLHEFAYSSVLFGHMNFEGRHDLFSINLNALLFDRNTKLKYFAEKVITSGLRHYINEASDLSSEEEAFFGKLSYSALIVYPYNPFTSNIIGNCDNTKKYSEYIWGLTPVNIIYAGETLEYSDNYKNCLKDKMDCFKRRYPDKPIKVIIFDTLSYSGRTRQEIYGFLNSITPIEIVYVSVIDAKVSHYDKPQNEMSFMNLNIPLLGTSYSCEICVVLEKLKLFKDSLIDARIIGKIDDLLKQWGVKDVRQAQEIIVPQNFTEIKAIDFMRKNSRYYIDENISFKNVIPLYLYITNRIKIENDFSIIEEFLNAEESVLNSESIIFICSVFLLEYREKIYFSILMKVCNILFQAIFSPDSGEVDRIKQLVLLSLLVIKKNILWRILKKYLSSLEDSNHIVTSSKEGIILLLYFIEIMKNDNSLNKTEMFYLIMNKCKSGNIRLDLYKQFHCQLINTNGRIHNSPLQCMAEDKVTDWRLTKSSLELIKQSLNNDDLRFDILYEDRFITSNEKGGAELIELCLVKIDEAMSELNNNNCDVTKLKKGVIKEIYDICIQVHAYLFAPFFISSTNQNRQKESIIDKIYNVIEEHNKNAAYGDIVLDESYKIPHLSNENIEAIYYIWNNMLSRELYYILDNVSKYSEESDCVLINNSSVAGQVKVKIEEMAFYILIYNNSKNKIGDIKRRSKNRYQKEVLKMLGITIEYRNNSKQREFYNDIFAESAVITIITIPNIYIG